MAENNTQTTAADEAPREGEGLEHGAYEIIRNRLTSAGRDLCGRLERLGAARKEVFGAIEQTLLATERITTLNNCVPRDMTPVGDCFIFGYNVHMGLKSEVDLEDVFSIYAFRNRAFQQKPLDLIGDERFKRDFKELFKYYKNTVFAKFSIIGPHLFMVFRVGRDVTDIKTFKWLVDGDRLRYEGNRSDHEFRFPPQHGFEWTRTHREMHASGPHPHVSIENRLFVETVGGDLTIKIEDNTATGEGIYAEEVVNKDQTLDDAEFFYAILENLILLKIRPYQEERFRYFVYCEKTREVRRIDAIEKSCVLLPDGHGIVFSNGYFLQTGEHKVFDSGMTDMLFNWQIASPGGEDYLYVFYNRPQGVYVLLPYNLIEQRIATPIVCNGFSLFENGEMVCFKCQETPQKHHAIQIWQTPYVGANYHPEQQQDSYLYRIGNRDVVRAMAECNEVLNLIAKQDTYGDLYVDLARKAGEILDAYYWIANEEACNLAYDLARVKEAAEAAIDEFEKVAAVRRNTNEETARIAGRTREIGRSILSRRFEAIGDYVASLGDLRAVRGEIIGMRDLRYVDTALVDALEKEVAESTARVAGNCVGFLLKPESLRPYEEAVVAHSAEIDGLQTGGEAKALEVRLSASAQELEMLIDVVGNLKIDDATHRTTIIDNISTIFAHLNQARSALKNRSRELMRTEGVAEFNSQIKLLNQGVVNYLDVCDTPQKCDEYLTRMMIQVEELEGRFAEFDEFVGQLTEKREEIYGAFETRKLQLQEARNKRTTALAAAADRILKGIQTRADALGTVSEIHGYFASDLMIEKVRDIVRDLTELGDTVRVDSIQSRLKTIREDAVRQLKDRQDLYEDGDNVIRLGKHKFTVNNQAFDLTTVIRDGETWFHLTGTEFFEKIDDPEFLETRSVWDQEVVSENTDVYRAEYLAYRLFRALGRDGVPAAEAARAMSEEELLADVRKFMGPRYGEGYVKGVHDGDAARILRALIEIDATAGLLRYHPRARAFATIFWNRHARAESKEMPAARIRGFGAARALFPGAGVAARYVEELRAGLAEYAQSSGLFDEALGAEAAAYLFEELASGARFVVSARARDLRLAFLGHLDQQCATEAYAKAASEVEPDAESAFLLRRDWVRAFLESRDEAGDADCVDEVAALLLEESVDPVRIVEASVWRTLDGMAGSHGVIEKKRYNLNYNSFFLKLNAFERDCVPRFEAYGRLKKELLERKRHKMRLDEFRPRVLTSFVRNKLIDTVYLNLVGDNLAKQIGVAGEAKRTDLMGLLLLISPPGYGKTTLMEYIANRLGIIFMKINGPALGSAVTSLDPAEAPNAAAREEMEKLNLSFEMGDNVMIYIDDIQHCSPEFLQKFISLCDAQRKIEGVYRGTTRTYDLRGKKVAVVMAGNPYTESGEQFKIPYMLANRADTYNLGEIIGASAEAFEMSYIENALTSNPALAKLASRSQKDVYAMIRMAESGRAEGAEFESNFSMAEVDEMLGVLRKLMRVRDVVLAANKEYIRSAAMADAYRTEPPFKLQGSYRNMNRIAGRVVALMNDAELEELILSSYQNDAQTLTSVAESNLLKFKELTGRMTLQERERWESIKRTFGRNLELGAAGGDDKFARMLVELGHFSAGLGGIREALDAGVARMVERSDGEGARDAGALEALRKMAEELKTAQRPEVRVVTRVPRAILDVMREQFRLMEEWLEPVHRETRQQNSDLRKLRKTIEENLNKYRALIDQLQEAAERRAEIKRDPEIEEAGDAGDEDGDARP